jgi:phage recombination protein Bet
MSETQARYQSNLPVERAIEYSVAGQSVRLTPAMVRQYLVHGKSELVTDQEIVFFMHICRARGLNPFNKDCYLVKYTPDPAAIIVSVDKLRFQARKSADCVGWKSGIVVQKRDGALRYSNGLILEGEKLLGGWFEGKPKGWEEPFRLEVNLNGYVKKTREGNTTRFWAPENQPTMIAKVAEAQGLRRLWPEQIQGLYLQEELSAGLHDEPIDISPEPQEQQAEAPVELSPERFGKYLDDPHLDRFIAATAQANRSSVPDVIRAANADADGFIETFVSWKKKQAPAEPEAEKPQRGRKTKAAKSPDAADQQPLDPEAPAPGENGDPPSIRAVLESEEYAHLCDLHRSDRALYEEAKAEVLKGQGPRTPEECQAMIEYMEQAMGR